MYRFVDCFNPNCPICQGKPVSDEPKPYFHNLEALIQRMNRGEVPNAA